MRDGRGNIDVGDEIRTNCTNCGEWYTYTKGYSNNPPRSTLLCPDCYQEHEQIRKAMVAGSWRVRNEDVREEMVELIEDHTPYEVRVEERLGDLYVYDPEKVEEE